MFVCTSMYSMHVQYVSRPSACILLFTSHFDKFEMLASSEYMRPNPWLCTAPMLYFMLILILLTISITSYNNWHFNIDPHVWWVHLWTLSSHLLSLHWSIASLYGNMETKCSLWNKPTISDTEFPKMEISVLHYNKISYIVLVAAV